MGFLRRRLRGEGTGNGIVLCLGLVGSAIAGPPGENDMK